MSLGMMAFSNMRRIRRLSPVHEGGLCGGTPPGAVSTAGPRGRHVHPHVSNPATRRPAPVCYTGEATCDGRTRWQQVRPSDPGAGSLSARAAH